MSTLHCSQTTKRKRTHIISTYRQRAAGGVPSAAMQFADELKRKGKAERAELLEQAGLQVTTTEVTAIEGLAMKVDLAIPWNKLRALRR